MVLVLVLVVVLVDVVVVGCGGFPGRAPAGVLLIRRPGATASATVRNRAKRASPRRRGWSPLRAVTWSHSASTCPHVSSTCRARKLEPSHEGPLDGWLAQDVWIVQVPSAASVAGSTPANHVRATATCRVDVASVVRDRDTAFGADQEVRRRALERSINLAGQVQLHVRVRHDRKGAPLPRQPETAQHPIMLTRSDGSHTGLSLRPYCTAWPRDRSAR